jgi:hypothetical protein
LGCKTNQRSIPSGYLLNLLIHGHQGTLVFSGIFIAEEVDGLGDKRSGDTTAVYVQTHLVLFQHVPEMIYPLILNLGTR